MHAWCIPQAAQVIFKPYHHVATNRLDEASVYVLLATLYLTLYFLFDNSVARTGRMVISFIIVFMNISEWVTHISG